MTIMTARVLLAQNTGFSNDKTGDSVGGSGDAGYRRVLEDRIDFGYHVSLRRNEGVKAL